jgi:L-asparagine transporter-like permease
MKSSSVPSLSRIAMLAGVLFGAAAQALLVYSLGLLGAIIGLAFVVLFLGALAFSKLRQMPAARLKRGYVLGLLFTYVVVVSIFTVIFVLMFRLSKEQAMACAMGVGLFCCVPQVLLDLYGRGTPDAVRTVPPSP